MITIFGIAWCRSALIDKETLVQTSTDVSLDLDVVTSSIDFLPKFSMKADRMNLFIRPKNPK